MLLLFHVVCCCLPFGDCCLLHAVRRLWPVVVRYGRWLLLVVVCCCLVCVVVHCCFFIVVALYWLLVWFVVVCSLLYWCRCRLFVDGLFLLVAIAMRCYVL